MVKNNSQALADKFDKLDALANTAQYTRNMSMYFDCIATSPKIFVDSKNPRVALTPAEAAARKKDDLVTLRKAMADETITALREFDTPDVNVPPDPATKNPGTNVQAKVRNMIAKLQMAAGDYKEAKASFFFVYSDLAKGAAPTPLATEQYEARYFSVVCDILNGDLAGRSRG